MASVLLQSPKHFPLPAPPSYTRTIYIGTRHGFFLMTVWYLFAVSQDHNVAITSSLVLTQLLPGYKGNNLCKTLTLICWSPFIVFSVKKKLFFSLPQSPPRLSHAVFSMGGTPFADCGLWIGSYWMIKGCNYFYYFIMYPLNAIRFQLCSFQLARLKVALKIPIFRWRL